MTLLNASLAPEFAWAGWLLLAPVVLLALRAVRDGFLPESGQQHAWLAGLVCIAFLWTLQVKLGNGPGIGMLGAALYVLLFGAARGILGLLLALVLHHVLTDVPDAAWFALGTSGLLYAVLPALLTAGLQQALARWLPKNLFIFIIGNGLFVTLAATAITSVALLLCSLALEAAPAAAGQLGDYVGYALLLAWGEALVSGMVFSALVIFTPSIVRTYRQDTYLPPRRLRG
jgi:uncharacterized membrane protein